MPNFHRDPGVWGRAMPPRLIPAALSHSTSFDKVDKVALRPDLIGLGVMERCWYDEYITGFKKQI
jgi:hypothetical protein